MCRFFLSLLLVSFALTAAPCRADSVAFKRVWLEYREAERFDRLGEYLTGREQITKEPVLRTENAQRSGHYWLVRFDHDGAATSARVELQVIGPDRPDVLTFAHFPELTLREGEQVIHVGLTHDLWRESSFRPVAWQVRLLDSEGRELARQSSYLW